MINIIKKYHLPILITIFALAGFFAAFQLTLDKIQIIKNPDFAPACSVNSVFNCGAVMRTKYAEIFGFPNSLLGVAGYPLAIITGLFLFQYRKLNKFFTTLTTALPLVAFAVSYYWLTLSAYIIGIFCPWCLVSTVSTTIITFALITIHLQENNYNFSEKRHELFKRKIKAGYNILFVIFWFIAVILYAAFPFIIASL